MCNDSVQYSLYILYSLCNILAVRGVVQNPVSCSSLSHLCIVQRPPHLWHHHHHRHHQPHHHHHHRHLTKYVIIITITMVMITTPCDINNPSPSVFNLLQLDWELGPEISKSQNCQILLVMMMMMMMILARNVLITKLSNTSLEYFPLNFKVMKLRCWRCCNSKSRA